MRPIQVTIDLGALRHNLQRVRACAPNSKTISVIKANGYGHGLLNAAQGLAQSDMFAVERLEEAAALRHAGYAHPILLLEGAFDQAELEPASILGLGLVVHCEPQILMLEKARLPKKLTVFVKANTGMNRLGFAPEAFKDAVKRLEHCENVGNIVLMTHFANADLVDGIAQQHAVFGAITQDFAHEKSLANSAAILQHTSTHADWVRPGIMLYGATPIERKSAASLDLRPAMTLASEIIAIQNVKAGQGVGYGGLFIAPKNMLVGIVACGYADGYPRHALNAPILVAGKITQTVGRVSMDMLCVDLTPAPEANIGVAVELWGNQVPVDAVAESCGTIGYELLCAVTPRVPMKVITT